MSTPATRKGWTFAGDPQRCATITGHPTKSEFRPTASWASEVADVDGNKEDRRGTISLFTGPEPAIQTCSSTDEETAAVSGWIAAHAKEGVTPHEIGVFVRSPPQLDRARVAVTAAGIPSGCSTTNVETVAGQVSVGTMHLAKGLEFRSVAVMRCDEVISLQERIETVTDDADLEDVYNTERHRLAAFRFAFTGFSDCGGFLLAASA